MLDAPAAPQLDLPALPHRRRNRFDGLGKKKKDSTQRPSFNLLHEQMSSLIDRHKSFALEWTLLGVVAQRYRTQQNDLLVPTA